MLWRVFFLLFFFHVTLAFSAQAQVVFNRTEHDFGLISRQAGYFEQDFIFRNTGDKTTRILSVKSVQSALSFIYTRSEVYEGEYGFVKVKIHTDSLKGLFHDEVYITLQYGEEVQSEVLYLRAKIVPQGRKKDDRQFEDGALSTSVEVSPSDIETMEGFMGDDKLSQAQSEIEYLKKQVAMKSDLIAKLSDDLFSKREQERENFQRLAELEKTLKENKDQGNQDALKQLDDLTGRLTEMRSSDSLLRQEISDQEREYAELKAQADSARNYAEDLSAQLQEKFKSEAEAMERAQQLEEDLKVKEAQEQKQQSKIDSLNRVLAMSGNDKEVQAEIEKLERELAIRNKEQKMQAEHAKKQSERIYTLKEENDYFKQSADSLANIASSSQNENQALQQRLQESTVRISSYESKIDSLQVLTSEVGNQERASIEELNHLKSELAQVEQRDSKLQAEITQREEELESLQEERETAERNMNALERATTKQQEQAHELMYRLNGLAKRESEAQIEINSLNRALKESKYREDSTRQSVNDLVARIAEKESSITDLSAQIDSKETELSSIKREQQSTQEALDEAKEQLNSSDGQIDSLQQLLASKNNGASSLESEIGELQKKILTSHQKQQDYQDRAAELEGMLANARLSNDLTFKELKGEVDAISQERDRYKDDYKDAEKRIEELEKELKESKRNEESAIAFANELQGSSNENSTRTKVNENVVYAINVLTSDQPVNMGETFKGLSDVREYFENGRYRYAVGESRSFKEALKEKDRLKSKGFDMAFVVAFRDGSRISLKEALETAQR